jgi:hypothetical protein
MSFKACTTQSECDQQFPGTFCTAARVCQVMLHLQACTDDASCPWRGFKCVDRAQYCGPGAAGRVCAPQITPAKVACVQGHL